MEDKAGHDSTSGALQRSSSLPELPVPELKALIERHLSYVRAFATEEEYSRTVQIAEEIQKPGSSGVRLYERLLAIKKANPDSWYHDHYLRNQYLIRKGALAPYMNFFFTHPLVSERHSQAERAAVVVSTLVGYKSALERGLVKPRYVNEQPLCMGLYKYLFNTTRIPKVKADLFERYQNHNYFVIFRRGHAFKVEYDDSDPMSHHRLEAVFQAILNTTLDGVDWLGILTADHRVSWALVMLAPHRFRCLAC
jgi:hypothetical protein